jgi:hypothetical protein
VRGETTSCDAWGLLRRATVVIFVVVTTDLAAMTGGAQERSVRALPLDSAPTIDGVVGEDEWAGAAITEGLVQFEPEFGLASPFPTQVLIGATAEALYVAFRCGDPNPERIAAAVTSRDGDLERDDSVAVMLDTLHDRRTGYVFFTNLLGVQTDAKIADNGRTVDERWDGTWSCAATRTADGWSVEFEIPFRMMRFAGGEAVTWGINFQRRVPRHLETSVWSGPGESEWRVSSFGTLTDLDVRATGLKKLAVIPYGLLVVEKDKGVDTRFGGDLRFRVSSGLSADLTINPDFALIEADVEEINLTRFELRVPEKRNFFLEGLEMFDQRITQFYSRRIGDIVAGGKLVGDLGGFDIAAIATRADVDLTPGTEESTIVDANYSVLRLQRGIFGSSTIGLLAANRNVEGVNAGSVGADMTLFFTDTLGMTGQFLRSHGPTGDGTRGWFLRPAYDSATSHFHVRYTSLDAGLKDNVNVIGFLEDDDRREVDAEAEHRIWFQNSAVENIKGGLNYNRYWSQQGELRSWEVDAEVETVFTSGWQVALSYIDEFKLYEKEFSNSLTSVEVGYDNRRGRSVFISFGSGTNFDSDLTLATLDAEFRISSAWSCEYEGTWLELEPDPEGDSTWIHVFRTSYYVTNNLFATLFVQTNSAIAKDNVQLLAVWRFRPPFGSFQVAYQRGTSEIGRPSEQGDTVFTKLSWIF